MRVSKQTVWLLVEKVFPSYKGRKFSLFVTDQVTFHDLNWSGGTRSQYGAVQISNGQARLFSQMNVPPPWSNPVEGVSVTLLPGVAVIQHSFFCGRDCGITVYVNPATAEQCKFSCPAGERKELPDGSH